MTQFLFTFVPNSIIFKNQNNNNIVDVVCAMKCWLWFRYVINSTNP